LLFYRIIYEYLYSDECATICVDVPIFFLFISDV
jgi:hypothetical protein